MSLLSRSPKNGTEIMNSIEEMTQGWWRPSPGTIYPLLEHMEKEEGLIRKNSEGRYELTDRSKHEIDWPPWMQSQRPQGPDEMLSELNGYISYFEDLSKSDRQRFEPHLKELVALRERLSAITKEGGEKQ